MRTKLHENSASWAEQDTNKLRISTFRRAKILAKLHRTEKIYQSVMYQVKF